MSKDQRWGIAIAIGLVTAAIVYALFGAEAKYAGDTPLWLFAGIAGVALGRMITGLDSHETPPKREVRSQTPSMSPSPAIQQRHTTAIPTVPSTPVAAPPPPVANTASDFRKEAMAEALRRRPNLAGSGPDAAARLAVAVSEIEAELRLLAERNTILQEQHEAEARKSEFGWELEATANEQSDRAHALLERGQRSEALAIFKRLIRSRSKTGAGLDALYEYMLEALCTGDYAEALNLFRQAESHIDTYMESNEWNQSYIVTHQEDVLPLAILLQHAAGMSSDTARESLARLCNEHALPYLFSAVLAYRAGDSAEARRIVDEWVWGSSGEERQKYFTESNEFMQRISRATNPWALEFRRDAALVMGEYA